MAPLSHDESVRYARHLTLPEVGLAGQERLRNARVLIVGAGGLGSPAALYLAAAGVGTIGLVDFDRVETSNLQRQILHGTKNLGQPKTASAAARLADLNPEIRINAIETRLDRNNALAIIGEYQLTLDGSDNFPTRYLVNDASVLIGTPYVYGSIFRFEGQVSVLAHQQGPCYRCLFAEPPSPGLVPNCAEAGVLGVLPGVIGTMQAVEAIKIILGVGDPLVGRLLHYDALSARVRELAVAKDPACPICGGAPTIRAPIDYEAFCGVDLVHGVEIAPTALRTLLSNGAAITVVDVREGWEWNLGRIVGSVHLPLGQLASRLGELDPNRALVTVCHKGQRSLQAQRMLAAAGFRAQSLAGGVDAWAAEIDPTLARY